MESKLKKIISNKRERDLILYILNNKLEVSIEDTEINYSELVNLSEAELESEIISILNPIRNCLINRFVGNDTTEEITVNTNDAGCTITGYPGCCGKVILNGLDAEDSEEIKHLMNLCYLCLRAFTGRSCMSLIHGKDNIFIRTLKNWNDFFVSNEFVNRGSKNQLVELTKYIYE